jgi:hypothetical protein
MGDLVRVSVMIDTDDMPRLKALATMRAHETVAEFAGDLLEQIARVPDVANADDVVMLHAAQFTDKQIGQKLGLTNAQVKYRRNLYQLPANPITKGRTA